jgi:phenylacetic acid degradation protein PaaD
MYAADAASQSLGIRVDEVAPGRATASMTVRPDMINGQGLCHGGLVFTLADTAFAFACNSYNDRTVSVDAVISYLASAYAGQVLAAAATERARRGRTGVYDVTVTADDGTVVAEFRGRSRSMREPLIPPG